MLFSTERICRLAYSEFDGDASVQIAIDFLRSLAVFAGLVSVQQAGNGGSQFGMILKSGAYPIPAFITLAGLSFPASCRIPKTFGTL